MTKFKSLVQKYTKATSQKELDAIVKELQSLPFWMQ